MTALARIVRRSIPARPATHTAGLWTISRRDRLDNVIELSVALPDGDVLYFRSCADRVRTAEANARLIAAAPDLLAACYELVAEFDADSERAAQEPDCGGLNETGGIVLARAAIARAEGGNP